MKLMKLPKLSQQHQSIRAKQYLSGEEFLYLGKTYLLTFENVREIRLVENQLQFPKALQFRVQKELTLWYIIQGRETITRRVQWYAHHMHTVYASLTFSDTKSQWGSCSADNRLQFSWRLVIAPLPVLDYVVVHELAHTTEKNHTWKFWSKVRFVLPAYNQRRKWLQTYGQTLII